MTHPWIEAYLLLALRIDRAFTRLGDGPFVDTYYGPARLRAAAAGEPPPPAGELLRAADALQDSLPSQGFARPRANFLQRQVRAMQVFCRLLAGQERLRQADIPGCLDVEPVWKPEAEFERTLAQLNQALPGAGSLRARYQACMGQFILPPDQAQTIRPLMQELLHEARRRTQRFADLPKGEELAVHTVHDKPYGAANWYLGSYRSRLELNVDRPVNLLGLLYQMCHEAYPGHHTEFALKEQHLVHQREYLEQTVFIISPQLVIAEGIASLAMQMIFTPAEIAAWLTEQISPQLARQLEGLDLPKFIQALSGIAPDDLGGNLVLMRWQGSSTEQIVEYALEVTPHAEGQIRGLIASLDSPLKQAYAFTYYQGKRLMQPLLGGPDRTRVFSRLLTEQVYPSQLAEWAGARATRENDDESRLRE